MKYKPLDKVRIKSLEWYKNNRDLYGHIVFPREDEEDVEFDSLHADYCGQIMTIRAIVYGSRYIMEDDIHESEWTDEMIEGLVEEETKPLIAKIMDNIIEEAKTYWDSIKDAWICPEGYIFKDENGNVINATKIVLEKKKKEYPKTLRKCCEMLDIDSGCLIASYDIGLWKDELLGSLQKLLICRNAYWKIAGEEMGLGKPWEPDLLDDNQTKFALANWNNTIENSDYSINKNYILTFPTEEMRDAFYENFKELINECKELL